MKAWDGLCGWMIFGLVLAVVLASPWLFGAWEMWWFWPFAVAIFFAAALFGLRMVLAAWIGFERLHFARLSRRVLLAASLSWRMPCCGPFRRTSGWTPSAVFCFSLRPFCSAP